MKHTIARLFSGAALFTLLALPHLSHAQTAPISIESCPNLLLNGSMEDVSGWRFDQRSVDARYTDQGLSGRGMLLSLTSGTATTQRSWSSATQAVALPAGGRSVLSFWYQLQRSDASDATQQVMLLDEQGEVLTVLITDAAPTTTWQPFTADLSAYAGRTVQIFASVAGNVGTGSASLIIDEISLCDPNTSVLPPATPEASTTAQADEATPEPTPTADEAAEEATPQPSPVAIITPQPTLPSPPPIIDPATIISFSDLQIDNLALNSPLGTQAISFRLPAGWELQPGAALQLDLRVSIADRMNSEQFNNTGEASLNVQLNGVDLAPVALSQLGNSAATLLIPERAFTGVDASGEHRLRLTIADGPQCLPRRQVSVNIQPTSRMLLPHNVGPVSLSLSQLPRPIIQGSFLPDTVAIVVADQPSAGELRAALIAAASLGHLSAGQATLSFTTASRLTDEMLTTNNLIFVGTSANLASMSAPALDQVGSAREDDGIIQLVTSPWNSSKAALILSGANESGVIKAGQAFSSGALQPSSSENTAIISSVQTNIRISRIDVDRTFSALGYNSQTIEGSGSQALSYLFNVPAGEAISGDAYLSLVFNHAATIDYESSTATVTLNDQPIGNILLSELSTQINSLRIAIPNSSIRFGQNKIAISANLQPKENCLATNDSDIWLTAWPESLLHLPLEPLQDATAPAPNLGSYPAPFAFNPTLSTTAFIMSPNDPDAWEVAADIAFDLGYQVQSSSINLNIGYEGALEESMVNTHNLIAVGRPSDLPSMSNPNVNLPLEFNGDNTLTEEYGAIIAYRLADDTDIGYLEAITSPWNEDYVLMTVLGNTTAGVRQAGAALTNAGMRQQVSGNLSVINRSQVISGVMPGVSQAPTESNAAIAPSITAAPEFRRPAWIVPTIMGSIVLIAAILGFVVFNAVRQRKISR